MRKYFAQEPRFFFKLQNRKRNSEHVIRNHQEELRNSQKPQKRLLDVQNVDYGGPFGFIWANNSCAFDALILLLIYGAKILFKEDQLMSFREEFPQLHESIFKLAHTQNPSDFRNLKGDLNHIVVNSPRYRDLNIQPNEFVSVLDVYFGIFSYEGSSIATNETCVYSEYVDVAVCHPDSTNHQESSSRNYFVLLSTDQISIQENLNRRDRWPPVTVKLCSVCGSSSTYKKYTRTPMMLFFGLDLPLSWLQNGRIDTEIVYGGVSYVLFGAIYMGGNHYRVRFLHRNGGSFNVWENDGMKNNLKNKAASKCIICNKRNPFPIRFQDYIVDMVLYVKRNLISGDFVCN